MCQEIYNWIFDNQNEYLKGWIAEYDPQRSRYYFDNDKTHESTQEKQQSEHEEEEDETDGW